MINHIQNLKDYIQEDIIYNDYLKRPAAEFNDFEKFCILHIEDIKWLLGENEALYQLILEMKKKYETIKS